MTGPATSCRDRPAADVSDDSIRCMTIRRTTLAAEADDLTVLEGEARRRGASLSRVFQEIVAREAAALRRRHRPRFGIGRGGAGAAHASARDETAPARRNPRS